MNERSYPLCFARALGRPLLTGRIRRTPQDFLVTERLGFEPEGTGEHLYLHVRKTGANTAWVAGEIARCAGVRSADVGYAGRKDRHAVAEQWFSCRLPGRLAPDWRQLRQHGIEVLGSRRHPKKLRLGMHASNGFRLVVRDLDAAARIDEAIEDLRARLEALATMGFPNYFGEQRFGTGRANLVHADDMIQGREYNRRKQGMYISAARSYLFNRQLSRRVADGTWTSGDDTGWLWGISRTGASMPADAAFEDWCAGLERLGVKAMRRELRVVPADFRSKIEDGSLVLSFDLPAGSFATSLLRELVSHGTTRTGETLGQTA